MRPFLCAVLSVAVGGLVAALPAAYAGEVTEEHHTYNEEHSETIHAAPMVKKETTETTIKQRGSDNDDENDNRDTKIKVKTEHN
jgi:hypothetical protein